MTYPSDITKKALLPPGYGSTQKVEGEDPDKKSKADEKSSATAVSEVATDLNAYQSKVEVSSCFEDHSSAVALIQRRSRPLPKPKPFPKPITSTKPIIPIEPLACLSLIAKTGFEEIGAVGGVSGNVKSDEPKTLLSPPVAAIRKQKLLSVVSESREIEMKESLDVVASATEDLDTFKRSQFTQSMRMPRLARTFSIKPAIPLVALESATRPPMPSPFGGDLQRRSLRSPPARPSVKSRSDINLKTELVPSSTIAPMPSSGLSTIELEAKNIWETRNGDTWMFLIGLSTFFDIPEADRVDLLAQHLICFAAKKYDQFAEAFVTLISSKKDETEQEKTNEDQEKSHLVKQIRVAQKITFPLLSQSLIRSNEVKNPAEGQSFLVTAFKQSVGQSALSKCTIKSGQEVTDIIELTKELQQLEKTALDLRCNELCDYGVKTTHAPLHNLCTCDEMESRLWEVFSGTEPAREIIEVLKSKERTGEVNARKLLTQIQTMTSTICTSSATANAYCEMTLRTPQRDLTQKLSLLQRVTPSICCLMYKVDTVTKGNLKDIPVLGTSRLETGKQTAIKASLSTALGTICIAKQPVTVILPFLAKEKAQKASEQATITKKERSIERQKCLNALLDFTPTSLFYIPKIDQSNKKWGLEKPFTIGTSSYGYYQVKVQDHRIFSEASVLCQIDNTKSKSSHSLSLYPFKGIAVQAIIDKLVTNKTLSVSDIDELMLFMDTNMQEYQAVGVTSIPAIFCQSPKISAFLTVLLAMQKLPSNVPLQTIICSVNRFFSGPMVKYTDIPSLVLSAIKQRRTLLEPSL